MKNSAHKLLDSHLTVEGVYSRKEVAGLIISGHRNVASHGQGKPVPSVCHFLSRGVPKTLQIRNSKSRNQALSNILSDPSASTKREIRENIKLVFEELTTNAIYHSYQNEGREKYIRTNEVDLKPDEAIEISYHWTKEGIRLSVSDRGGNLAFEQIIEALKRCYFAAESDKIASKDSGAGLGLFMVFESVQHLHIEVLSKKSTTVSVWISERKSNEGDFTFSFVNDEDFRSGGTP